MHPKKGELKTRHNSGFYCSFLFLNFIKKKLNPYSPMEINLPF